MDVSHHLAPTALQAKTLVGKWEQVHKKDAARLDGAMYEALLVKASKDGKLSDKALAEVRAVQPLLLC